MLLKNPSIKDGQHFRNTMKLPCQYGKEEKLAFIRDLAKEINAEVNIPQQEQVVSKKVINVLSF